MEPRDSKLRRFFAKSEPVAATPAPAPAPKAAGGLRLVDPAPAGGAPIPTIGRMIARTALLADQALKRKK